MTEKFQVNNLTNATRSVGTFSNCSDFAYSIQKNFSNERVSFWLDLEQTIIQSPPAYQNTHVPSKTFDRIAGQVFFRTQVLEYPICYNEINKTQTIKIIQRIENVLDNFKALS